jgi:hypothetical protein
MDRWFANSEALGPAQAAALPMALSTAYWHLARLGLDRGKGVLVRGTGTTVGSAAVQITLVRGMQVLATAPVSGALPAIIQIAGGDPKRVLTISDLSAALEPSADMPTASLSCYPPTAEQLTGPGPADEGCSSRRQHRRRTHQPRGCRRDP